MSRRKRLRRLAMAKARDKYKSGVPYPILCSVVFAIAAWTSPLNTACRDAQQSCARKSPTSHWYSLRQHSLSTVQP